MSAAKPGKKDLEQPDVFFETVEKLSVYVRENRNRLFLAGGVLAIALIAAGGWFFYHSHNEREASRLHFEAKLRVMKADPMGAGTAAPEAIQAVRDVVDRYPSTEAAQSARYELGSLYYAAGDFDQCIGMYRAFLDRSGPKDVRTVFAWSGIGYAYESKREYDRALEAFQKILELNPGDFGEAMGYRNIARVYEELNQRDKALDAYKKALEKTSDPAASSLLKRKIAGLG